MNMCSSVHKEIVYEVGLCPLCEVLMELDNANGKIEELEQEIKRLNNMEEL